MDRTTLTLPEETRRKLRRIAAERGMSMAALIREAIDEKVERMAPLPRSLGSGASGLTDTGRRSGEEHPEPPSWR